MERTEDGMMRDNNREMERGIRKMKRKVKTESISVTQAKTWCHTATCRRKVKLHISAASSNYATSKIRDQYSLSFQGSYINQRTHILLFRLLLQLV